MVKAINFYGNIVPPGGKDKYFFTITLNKKGDGISFDNTIKGHRILKQINAGKVDVKNEVVREEWDTYHFIDGVFRGKVHEKWVDRGKDDVINGIVWRQIWEVPTPGKIDKILIGLNDFLWKNRKSLNSKQVVERVRVDGERLNEFILRMNK